MSSIGCRWKKVDPTDVIRPRKGVLPARGIWKGTTKNGRNKSQPEEYPAFDQRSTALVHPGGAKSRNPDAQFGPLGGAGDALRSCLHGQPHLHSNPGLDYHGPVSKPAR